jgi:hypothetical protein
VDALELLTKLGLPSAIIALVVISFIFKDKFEKLARMTLTVAIVLMAIIGITQLVAWISGKDVTVTYSPKQFYAVSLSGEAVDLKVSVKKGGATLVADSVLSLDLHAFEARTLTVEHLDEAKLSVRHNDHQQGTVTYSELRNSGWIKANEAGADSHPNYWFTHKVYVGETIRLGKAQNAGEMSLSFLSIHDNKAFVKLAMKGSEKPRPETVGIQNKQVGSQDFQNMPTFHIAVREANFAEKWAAFSVLQY